jgi:hypothetical protein
VDESRVEVGPRQRPFKIPLVSVESQERLADPVRNASQAQCEVPRRPSAKFDRSAAGAVRTLTEAPQARPEGSQGQVRSTPPLDQKSCSTRPGRADRNARATCLPPFQGSTLLYRGPGAACFALAPGYLLLRLRRLDETEYPCACGTSLVNQNVQP